MSTRSTFSSRNNDLTVSYAGLLQVCFDWHGMTWGEVLCRYLLHSCLVQLCAQQLINITSKQGLWSQAASVLLTSRAIWGKLLNLSEPHFLPL